LAKKIEIVRMFRCVKCLYTTKVREREKAPVKCRECGGVMVELFTLA